VNTEVRCTANRIEFRTGDKLVGTYDKGANRWELYESGGQFRIIIDGTKVVGQFGDNSKSFRVDNDHTHIRFGDNAMWVNRDGCFSSTAIVVAPDNCN